MNNLSGLIDRKVLLEKSVKAPKGEPNPIWEAVATVWAGKKDETGGKEGQDGKTIVAEASTTWLLRYSADVLPTMRLTDLTTGIVYDIKNVMEIGRREATQLSTKRINQ